MFVERAIVGGNQRPLGTKPHTADSFDPALGFHSALVYFPIQRVFHCLALTGEAARCNANVDGLRNGGLRLTFCGGYVLKFFRRHLRPISPTALVIDLGSLSLQPRCHTPQLVPSRRNPNSVPKESKLCRRLWFPRVIHRTRASLCQPTAELP